jgi:hypothetical protein
MRKFVRVPIEEQDLGMPVGLMSIEDYTEQLSELPFLRLATEMRVIRIEGKIGAPVVVLELPQDVEVIQEDSEG